MEDDGPAAKADTLKPRKSDKKKVAAVNDSTIKDTSSDWNLDSHNFAQD